MSIQSLELELKKSLAPSKRDFDRARDLLSQIRTQGASDARLAYLEAMIVGFEKKNRKGDALRMIMTYVIEPGCEEIDLLVVACMDAMFFALPLNDVTTIKRLHTVFDDLLANHADHEAFVFWRGTIELNIGCFYVINRRYNEAVVMLRSMIEHANDDPSYACHITKAHAQLAIALTRLGRLSEAEKHARLADATATGRYMSQVQRAWGEIYLAEKNTTEALNRFILAQSIAVKYDEQSDLAWSTLGLCRVYKATDLAAYAQSAILVRVLAMNNDLPCVLEALAEIDAGTS